VGAAVGAVGAAVGALVGGPISHEPHVEPDTKPVHTGTVDGQTSEPVAAPKLEWHWYWPQVPQEVPAT